MSTQNIICSIKTLHNNEENKMKTKQTTEKAARQCPEQSAPAEVYPAAIFCTLTVTLVVV